MTLYSVISIAVWSIVGLGVLAALADYVTRRRGMLVLPRERRCVTGLFSADAEMRQRALDDFGFLRPHCRERVLAHLFNKALMDTPEGYRALRALGKVVGLVRKSRSAQRFLHDLNSQEPCCVQSAAEGIAQLTEWIERENLKASVELSLRDAVQRLERTRANDSETTAALDALHRALQAIGAETREQPTPLPQAA